MKKIITAATKRSSLRSAAFKAIPAVMILAFMMASANAAGCGTLPSKESALITSCIPINITNTQGVATSSGFQVMLSNFPVNAIAGNYLIYNSISGATLPAWTENSNLVWVNLGASTITADSSANQIYVIGLGSSGTNFFISGNNVGEAPQLSPTYAEYDNGNSVFDFYDNFSGTSLNTNLWDSNIINGASITVSNKLILTQTSASSSSAGIFAKTAFNTPFVEDVYSLPYQNNAQYIYLATIKGTPTQCTDGSYANSYAGELGGASASDIRYELASCSATTLTNPNTYPGYTFNGIYSMSWSATGAQSINYNYGNTISATDTSMSLPTTAYLGIATLSTSVAGNVIIQWARVRTPPPNGVQPAIAYGAAQQPSSSPLTITPNPATYGQSITLSASCTPSTDTCAVELPIGHILASGAGYASYTYTCASQATCLAVGTYGASGNDITAGTATTGSLTVNKATTALTLKYRGASVTNGRQFLNNLNASGFINGTITSLSGQLSASLLYDTSSPAVGTSTSTYDYNSVWNGKNNWANWTTAGNQNYTAAYANITVDYVPYVIISTPSISAIGYESASDLFASELNITKYATDTNTLLEENGIIINSSKEAITQGPQSISFSTQIPLLNANDIVYDFNSVLALDLQNGTILNTQYNALQQTERFNYIPAFSIAHAKSLEGDNNTLFLNISQIDLLNLANVSAQTEIGNQILSMHVAQQYAYYTNLYSFINSKYDLAMPAVGAPVTVTATEPIKLSLGQQSVWRNQTATFSTYLPSLITCNGTSDTAIKWDFYNASNPAQAWASNVLFTGSFQIINQLYMSNTIPGTSAGLSTNAIASNYTTCIYPNFGQFQASGSFQYSGTNTSKASYYLQQVGISNQSQKIALYLEELQNPIEYEIAVENVTSSTYISSLVQELLYDSNTNSSVLVDEFYTQAGAGTYTYLENQQNYKFIAYTSSYPYTLLSATNYLQAASCGSVACQFVINVGNFNINLIQSVLKGFQYGCAQTQGNANTSTVSCSFTSINGTSYNTSLTIYNKSAGTLGGATCQKYLVTADGSLNCQAAHTNNTQYIYQFQVDIPSYGWYTLAQNTFGTQQLAFGLDGIYIALLVLIAAAFLFITLNPSIALVAFSVAFTVLNFIGLVSMGIFALGMMWVGTALLLYIINRR